MSSILKRFIGMKIRRRRRWRAGNGIYVKLSHTIGKFQIDDIGMGGLSFHYIDTGLPSRNVTHDLKILSENQPAVIELEGRVVAENDTGELIFQKKKIKRRSVRFERLNSEQRQQLKVLIAQFIKK